MQLKTSPEYRSLKEEKDMFRRRMLFLGFFMKKLRALGADAILVGGEAIELYTGGTFATADIDLVVTNSAIAEKLLNQLGFGMEVKNYWFNKDLNIVVQIVGNSYNGDDAKIRKFRVREYEIKVVPPEDLIVNRLYSMKFWKSKVETDYEQARVLLSMFANSLDYDYLAELARKNDVADVLADIQSILK